MVQKRMKGKVSVFVSILPINMYLHFVWIFRYREGQKQNDSEYAVRGLNLLKYGV